MPRTENLAGVVHLGTEVKGWGSIAKDLGFKLGPVVSDANGASHELRAEARATETGSQKSDKEFHKGADDQGGRMQKTDHTEHLSRPERPERPQHPERIERPEKPEKHDR